MLLEHSIRFSLQIAVNIPPNKINIARVAPIEIRKLIIMMISSLCLTVLKQ